jgi:FkbM family methyltransferase
MSAVIDQLLADLTIRPVLIDIGASGAPPAVWQAIARHSTYVGFDPDLRETRDVRGGVFGRAVILNEAIATEREGGEVPFYLTKSPYCSSTLKPDLAALADYIFADLFVVERETRVRATSLNAVIERLSLPGIDWLKIDSQGTDLRIFNDLREPVHSRVLAVDIEPGLIDAYVGEDLFTDAHRDLTRQGFWLSDLKICGTVRLRKATADTLLSDGLGIDQRFLEGKLKVSPCWCEARYLRTLGWLADKGFAERDYALLWVFALLDKQAGFALDLGVEYEKRFGKSATARLLREEPVAIIKQLGQDASPAGAASLPRRLLRKVLRPLQKLWPSGAGN